MKKPKFNGGVQGWLREKKFARHRIKFQTMIWNWIRGHHNPGLLETIKIWWQTPQVSPLKIKGTCRHSPNRCRRVRNRRGLQI